MKKKFIVIFLSIIFIGCDKKRGLELEIVNESVTALTPNKINSDIRDSKENLKKSKTILTYKLTNNDNVPYYFNLSPFSRNEFSEVNEIELYRAKARFYDLKNKMAKINVGIRCYSLSDENCNTFSKYNDFLAKNLNYSFTGNVKFVNDYLNFIIYPNQTLYFEWFINLPYGNENDLTTVNFKEKENYLMEIVMYSDSTNYKKYISRTVLKTLEENKIKVYHGLIKSKNKIPVRFID